MPEPSKGAPIRESADIFSLRGNEGLEVRVPAPCPEGMNSEPVKFGDGAEI
jgi:hypothetical protein